MEQAQQVKTSIPDPRLEKKAPIKVPAVQTIDLLSGNSGVDKMNEIRENLKKVKLLKMFKKPFLMHN